MSFLSRLSLSSLRSALWRIAARCIARRVAARQQAHQRFELRGMSDHELKDLGLGRSEVQEWLRRSVTTRQAGTEARAACSPAAEDMPRPRAARPRRAAARRMPAGGLCA